MAGQRVEHPPFVCCKTGAGGTVPVTAMPLSWRLFAVPQKRSTFPRGVARSVPECTFTFICGRRGAPTTRCSELPWANAGPQLPHASPSSSKHSPGFHQNDLTSFVVASPKVAHMVETSGCAQPSWIASPRKSPVLDTRNPICPIPSQDRFAYWVRQVFLAT